MSQSKRKQFPTIFHVAMDYLPIQASSVPCERVFSSAKETATPRRNRISPATMRSLQLLKFFIKKGHSADIDFMADDRQENEERDLQAMMTDEAYANMTDFEKQLATAWAT